MLWADFLTGYFGTLDHICGIYDLCCAHAEDENERYLNCTAQRTLLK